MCLLIGNDGRPRNEAHQLTDLGRKWESCSSKSHWSQMLELLNSSRLTLSLAVQIVDVEGCLQSCLRFVGRCVLKGSLCMMLTSVELMMDTL
jgi:hypothetical protein